MNIASTATRIWASWRGLPAARRDAALIILACLGTIALAMSMDLFELILQAAADHEDWQLDELLTVLFVAPFGLVAYARRRERETRWEIERRVAAEGEVQHLAMHDPLTGLANRALLRERIAQALARARREQGQVGVMLLDLDRFKEVNDSLGHAAGDALLRLVAERLRGALRSEDTVARLGGDEFVVVQVGLSQPSGAASLAERLIMVLAEPYDLPGGHRAVCSASLGVAIAPVDGGDPDALLDAADTAMYRAKADGPGMDGRGTAQFFETGMDAVLRARRQLTAELRTALAEGGFLLHYQPVHNLSDGRVVSFEALLRWPHPIRGMVLPADFIPLAEETGLIVPIGDWVLRQACLDAAGWPDDVRVAVNLSPVQFRRGDPVAAVRTALSQAGLPASRLELEVTEGLLLLDTSAVLETLSTLRAMGVSIAMDDFGTGYSSLNYLWRFPFDRVKIDQSFIAGMGTNPKAAAIVDTVVGLGRTLGLQVTAEGIETAAQAEALGHAGCGQGQGYLLGRPMPADAARALLDHPSPGPRSAAA